LRTTVSASLLGVVGTVVLFTTGLTVASCGRSWKQMSTQGSSSMRRRLTIAAALATALASMALALPLALGGLIGLVALLSEIYKVILQEAVRT